jgi:hypothetical protein
MQFKRSADDGANCQKACLLRAAVGMSFAPKLRKGMAIDMNKKLLALLLAATMAAGTVALAAAAGGTSISQIIGDGNTVVFADVGSDFWAYSEIQYAASQGIVDGFPDGTFKPQGEVTREQFCKMMVLTFQAALKNPDTPTFSDVAPSDWAYQYVETCKDFLTGYQSPFDGSMTFHPGEYATREDIAVALAKMMGLGADGNGEYAQRAFSDWRAASPGLLKYIGAAAQNGLISGYPDGTFGPAKGITRAETVAMLNRASKTAVGDATAEIALSASGVFDRYEPQNFTLYVRAPKGYGVTVDGESVDMSDNGSGGLCIGAISYEFLEEGESTFSITAQRGANSRTIEHTVEYRIGAPTLKVNQSDSTVSGKYFTLSGSVSDSNSAVAVTINGASCGQNSSSYSWSERFELSEGANTFAVVATNEQGKQAAKTVTITLEVGGPTLKVNQADSTVSGKYFTLSGSVLDSNYSVAVTITGVSCGQSSSSYSWSKSLELSEGANIFTVVATSESGKQAAKTVTITLEVGEPAITFINCPETTSEEQISIIGSIGGNASGVYLFVNDKQWGYAGSTSFNQTVTLSEGENTFVFRAVNSYGKECVVTKTITRAAAA